MSAATRTVVSPHIIGHHGTECVQFPDLLEKWGSKLSIKKSSIWIEKWHGWTKDSLTWIFHGLESEDVCAFETSINSKLNRIRYVYFEQERCSYDYILQTN